ncbi:hypothetical protein DFH06DRAFT_1299465 [Mycena polygramma]|nr:hypothetical protein DFH06DRAFT_1299465 [Mycena polygramma]
MQTPTLPPGRYPTQVDDRSYKGSAHRSKAWIVTGDGERKKEETSGRRPQKVEISPVSFAILGSITQLLQDSDSRSIPSKFHQQLEVSIRLSSLTRVSASVSALDSLNFPSISLVLKTSTAPLGISLNGSPALRLVARAPHNTSGWQAACQRTSKQTQTQIGAPRYRKYFSNVRLFSTADISSRAMIAWCRDTDWKGPRNIWRTASPSVLDTNCGEATTKAQSRKARKRTDCICKCGSPAAIFFHPKRGTSIYSFCRQCDFARPFRFPAIPSRGWLADDSRSKLSSSWAGSNAPQVQPAFLQGSYTG